MPLVTGLGFIVGSGIEKEDSNDKMKELTTL